MALRVTFDLEDKDLDFFRAQMKRVRDAAQRTSEAEVIASAEGMIKDVSESNVPSFVLQRIERLQVLIDMLRDDEWSLTESERDNVVAALTYFADPEDIIPDNVPVLGYIDDAIMIELVVIELQHEIDAFEDFCRYRQEEASRNRNPDISRDEWLAVKRRDLHARMRRRRRRVTTRSQRTRIRLF
ncbi:MAG: DUF1232 domain-containing protein [Gammaproteobacteria bacterium]|nr:MAG: DUF1232 domain-containing protein [Gammaproteobacteria bacterium]